MTWSGPTFTRTGGSTAWGDDRDAGTEIEAGLHDTHDEDLAQGINDCLHKGGQNAATADISMGGFKLTNLAAPTADNDATRKAYVDDKTVTKAAAQSLSGGSRTYDFTGIPATATLIHIMIANGTLDGTTDEIQIKLGDSGGIESTGYEGSVRNNGASSNTTFSGAIQLINGNPAVGADWHGVVTLTLVDDATNTWVASWTLATDAAGGSVHDGAGYKALSGTLDRVQLGLSGSTDGWTTGLVAVNYQ